MATVNKYIVAVYGKLVISGKRTVDKAQVTEDCKLVPELYQKAVAEWVANYIEALNK